eukprot:6197315-Pleurochrysis_carterae.AAC.1
MVWTQLKRDGGEVRARAQRERGRGGCRVLRHACRRADCTARAPVRGRRRSRARRDLKPCTPRTAVRLCNLIRRHKRRRRQKFTGCIAERL